MDKLHPTTLGISWNCGECGIDSASIIKTSRFRFMKSVLLMDLRMRHLGQQVLVHDQIEYEGGIV